MRNSASASIDFFPAAILSIILLAILPKLERRTFSTSTPKRSFSSARIFTQDQKMKTATNGQTVCQLKIGIIHETRTNYLLVLVS